MRDHLFSFNKINYVRGDKPDVECILCAIRDKDHRVESLEVGRSSNFILSLNLYPYNPGHMMVFPLKHIETLDELDDSAALEMHKLILKAIKILDSELSPAGYNIGFNIGNVSGASILHLHQHIVPRYGYEAGFLDVLNGTRVYVVDPRHLLDSLRARFKSTS